MRVLVDGCVFGQPDREQVSEWWQGIMPSLLRRLNGQTVLFLNRTNRPVFQPDDVLRNLVAPAVDFECSAIEDRRLGALCRELAIDVFLSTYHTSAGAGVKTLYVALPEMWGSWPVEFLSEASVTGSARRAVNLANAVVALSEAAAEHVRQMGAVDEIWTVESDETTYTPELSDLYCEVVTECLATALRRVCTESASENVVARRLAEENEVATLALRLRQMEIQTALAIHAEHVRTNEGALRRGSLRWYVNRVYRAAARPSRYFEYGTRIYAWSREQIGR